MFKKLMLVALVAGTLMTASSSSVSAAPFHPGGGFHRVAVFHGYGHDHPYWHYRWDRFHHVNRWWGC